MTPPIGQIDEPSKTTNSPLTAGATTGAGADAAEERKGEGNSGISKMDACHAQNIKNGVHDHEQK